ncbi:elongation factor P [Candidatus Collierbacteria bacterium CG10_big_fil_rev_8_21_14_0_10_44_9]|uniref:Elongation factor P n=1 Tax=Candidatus Collierbacteria bacterium CG10_big_fil_rev_8_21_14_0_10_44_9 TaxID=1974535 RepID=A0A2H0VJC0_9BACT|nr:MAG: elongation factor P [Candidatus Collierbacteria bacterium CG10_big_fil_rev_8_21_14_0_10_44_9]
MSTMRANQLKTGVFVLYKDQPCAVVKCEFYFPGKGSAFARTRMKNVKTGNVYEYTFKSAEMVETVDVETVELQYLYKDGETLNFMNPRTFDQFEIPASIFEGKDKYLMPEMKMFFNFYEGEVIGVRFPLKVTVKVTEASEASAGNTVNAPKKPVTIETGVEVMAPLFVKQGEIIIVDTETGEYVSRA